jgi:hypothetical protein
VSSRPPVARTADREVQDIGAPIGEVAHGGVCGEPVRAHKAGVRHCSWIEDPLLDEIVEAGSARHLGGDREHDVAAVVVGEAATGRRSLRVAVEEWQVVRGIGQAWTGRSIT